MMFTALEIGNRMDRLRATLDGAGVDALLVTRLPNIRYLSGFTGSAAMLLVGRDGAVFVTDGRYTTQSAEQLGEAGVEAQLAVGTTQAERRDALAPRAREWGVARLGLEAHGVTWAQQRAMSAWFDAELVPTDEVVEGLRMVKEPGEVERIRAACEIGDDAFAAVTPMLAAAATEQAVALALEVAMRERGASGNSFDPIVAAGEHAAMPHARPSERPVERGELVVLDFGCIVDGYCSDMTRTVSVGEPDANGRRIWETVLESQLAGSAAVAADEELSAVDRACRDVIDAAGWGEAFSHGTGHGVGLEIHEAPRVAATASGTLQPGHVVTVEPGVYLPGVGGARIEDTMVVTSQGAVALTTTPKELVL